MTSNSVLDIDISQERGQCLAIIPYRPQLLGAMNEPRPLSSQPPRKSSLRLLKRKARESDSKAGSKVHISRESDDRLKEFFTFDPMAPELQSDVRTRVKYVLRKFDDIRRQYVANDKHSSGTRPPCLKAYDAFNGFQLHGAGDDRIVGNVPGVEVGDHFYFRTELRLVSLHGLLYAGIDYIPESKSIAKDGTGRGMPLAVSVVTSDDYGNDRDEAGGVLIYTGSGGDGSKDQQLVKGNLGLKNCCELRSPVRVIRGYKHKHSSFYSGPSSKIYLYDGLYDVVSADHKPLLGTLGPKVWQFKLFRQITEAPQPPLDRFKGKSLPGIVEGQVLKEDIGCGLEPFKVQVVYVKEENVVWDEFTYTTTLTFALGLTKPQLGPTCHCHQSCVSSESCSCTELGDGTDNYNEGCLLIAKRAIYECSSLCSCVGAGHCPNRVTQKGIQQHELEVFQLTDSKGWGVRSRSVIPQGTFVCEYIGQIIKDIDADVDPEAQGLAYTFPLPGTISSLEEMECRVGLADLGHRRAFKVDDNKKNDSHNTEKYTIDARQCGNLARFINHSDRPNLFVQRVFYDHHDQRFPHIIFFSLEHISPYVQLTYDRTQL